jgi:hypothetical protein
MKRWGRRTLGAAAALAAIAGCLDLGGPKSGVVAISNLILPYPSVVIGGLMRDSLGNPSPLSITAFGPDGNPIAGEPAIFIALDSTITVDADGMVHGVFRDSIGGRIVGGAGTLQAPAQRIIVTHPAELATKGTASTSIVFDAALPDSTEKQNWSPALTLALSGADKPAQGYVVTFNIVDSPTPAVVGASTAWIADESGKAMPRDTTDTQGAVSRRVIFRQKAAEAALLAGTKSDTIVVRATVKYLGADVPGSPVNFIVPVSKKP